MALSKNMNIMKALVEECLRRRGVSAATEPRDIEIALQVMRVVIEDPEVYLLADSPRFVEAFRESFDRPCIEITSLQDCAHMERGTVIALHTGDRTERQRIRYTEMLEVLKTNKEITIWHIGRWYKS